MQPVRPTLLLTRPEAQSRRFAAAFRARFGAGWPVVVAPLIEIVFLAPPLPGELPDHIVFTSRNAVDALARLTDDRRATAWCAGPATAAAAQAAGFATREGPGDAAGLGRMMIAAGMVRRVLYPRPVHAAANLDEMLSSAGIDTVSATVYDQRERPPGAAAMRLAGAAAPVLLPLFSPRSARLAARAFAGATAPIWIAAISPAVAAAAAGLPARGRKTASRPDGEAMLDALAALIAAAKTG